MGIFRLQDVRKAENGIAKVYTSGLGLRVGGVGDLRHPRMHAFAGTT